MQKYNPYPSLPQAWGIFGIFIAASIAAGLIITVVTNFANPESLSLGNLLGYIVSMGFVIWFAWHNKTGKLSENIFYFNKVPVVLYPLLIALTLSLAVTLDPVTSFLPMPDFVKELFAMLATKDIYTLLMVCILGPVLEELLFRGIILDGFLNRYKPGKAIFWSAFLFGLFHLNPWQFIPGFLVGIILAWIYFKTRSLLPVILIHVVNNSLSYYIMYRYGEDVMSFKDLFTDVSEYRVLMLSATGLFLIILFLLYRILKSYWPFQNIINQPEKNGSAD